MPTKGVTDAQAIRRSARPPPYTRARRVNVVVDSSQLRSAMAYQQVSEYSSGPRARALERHSTSLYIGTEVPQHVSIHLKAAGQYSRAALCTIKTAPFTIGGRAGAFRFSPAARNLTCWQHSEIVVVCGSYFSTSVLYATSGSGLRLQSHLHLIQECKACRHLKSERRASHAGAIHPRSQ